MKQTHVTNMSNRGFTLIELLVVISIIGLLSSVVLASVAVARVNAQNSARKQSVYQMNTAINMYITENGHVPLLDDRCGKDFSSFINNKCIARQTSSEGNNASAWNYLKIELEPYMKSLPVDPCGFDCEKAGYVYIAPAALYAMCSFNSEVCDKDVVDESSYQIYNPLQDEDKAYGFSTNGTYFGIPGNTY